MCSLNELLSERVTITVNCGASVKEAVNYMSENHVGLVPVLKDDRLAGVFSERDLVKRVIAANRDLYLTKVDEVMSTTLVTADANESSEEALAKMQQSNTRHILVLEDNKLIGVLSMGDLLKTDLLSCRTTVEVLNNYIYAK